MAQAAGVARQFGVEMSCDGGGRREEKRREGMSRHDEVVKEVEDGMGVWACGHMGGWACMGEKQPGPAAIFVSPSLHKLQPGSRGRRQVSCSRALGTGRVPTGGDHSGAGRPDWWRGYLAGTTRRLWVYLAATTLYPYPLASAPDGLLPLPIRFSLAHSLDLPSAMCIVSPFWAFPGLARPVREGWGPSGEEKRQEGIAAAAAAAAADTVNFGRAWRGGFAACVTAWGGA